MWLQICMVDLGNDIACQCHRDILYRLRGRTWDYRRTMCSVTSR